MSDLTNVLMIVPQVQALGYAMPPHEVGAFCAFLSSLVHGIRLVQVSAVTRLFV